VFTLRGDLSLNPFFLFPDTAEGTYDLFDIIALLVTGQLAATFKRVLFRQISIMTIQGFSFLQLTLTVQERVFMEVKYLRKPFSLTTR
jgi:hypothetical protein